MRINYNQSAILANSCLNRTDNAVAQSIERLSSGLKINHAKDNPAGLAVANRMNAQIGGLGIASDNTNDGISVVQTADGALSEITAIIQRMNELMIEAGTDSKTDEDRAIIDSEIQQLKSEATRIANDTEFNGQPLLDGTFELKGYTDDKEVNVDYYSDETLAGEYKINLAGILSLTSTDPVTYDVDTSSLTEANGFPQDNLKAVFEDNQLTITASGNFKITLGFDFPDSVDITKPDQVESFVNGHGETTLDITGIGAMKIQSGANEGQEVAIRIPEVSLKKMGIFDLKCTPTYDADGNLVASAFDNAQKGIELVKNALQYISDERSRLGAYENRLEHNETNLSVSEENMTSSYSRIMDVDMAEEMTEYTTQQVLQQAGISMLSQANEMPQQILQLLQ